MPRKYVSPRNFATPMGVVKGVRLHLKQFEKLSHENAPPVDIDFIEQLITDNAPKPKKHGPTVGTKYRPRTKQVQS